MMKRFVALAFFVSAVGLTMWFLRAPSRPSKNNDIASSEKVRGGAVVRATGKSADTPPAREDAPAGDDTPVAREPARGDTNREDTVIPGPAPDLAAAENRKREFLAPFRTGRHIIVAGQDFEILNLRAIPAADYRTEMGASAFEKIGFAFVAASAEPFAVKNGFPVIVKGNGMISVVTGTVIATLKENARPSAVAAAHDLQLKGTDADIRAAFYAADPSRSLGDVLRDLGADTDVESVILEIVQSRKRL